MNDKVATKEYQKYKKLKTKIKHLRAANLKMRSNLILHGTGHLKNSITWEANDTQVKVGPSENVSYARIHQLGGVIKPKSKNALFVPCGKRMLRLKKVTIPARPYLTVPQSEVPRMARIVIDSLQTQMYARVFRGRY